MLIEGINYEMLIASDVNTDAMIFECYRGQGKDRELILEVIRYDGLRKFVYVQHVENLPLAVVEHIVSRARPELGPYFVQ